VLIARPDARPTGDATGGAPPVRWVERVDHRLIAVLTVFGFGVPIVVYFWVVHHFGLNTIWIDQWSDLGLISHAYSGHLTLSTLWAQHTENRILFPNLVVLLLAHTTHFNVVDEEFLSAIILVVSTALLIVGHRRRSPTTPWLFYCPVAILMLSVVQSGNTLWGFQFAWYLVLLALSVTLVLCDSTKWNWVVAAGAISAAIVGSFSSLQGLLIWPAGLAILLLRNVPWRFVSTWIAAAAVTIAIYFVNFNPQLGDTNTYIVHHPLEGLRFFFFSVGDVIGAHGGNAAVVLGVLIVLMSLWLIFSSVVRRQDHDAPLLGVALICFGLLFALTIAAGRAAAGLNAGGASRYTTFDLLTLVGCYLALLSRRPVAQSTPRPRERVFRLVSWVVVGVIIGLQVVLGAINGLSYARSWHSTQLQASDVIVNMNHAPDSMIERVLVVNPYLVPNTRQLTRFARTNHLSLFDNESAVRQYAAAGLPYSANSLGTNVAVPRNGANVKKTVLLGATASSDYGVTKVIFVIQRSTGVSITTSAKHTYLGWLGSWDTIGVPNGNYTITCDAYDSAGHRAQSKAVAVDVVN
jgi:hypothetical protein